MYYGSGTVAHTANQWRHRLLTGERAAGGRCCICSSERRVDIMGAILKGWSRENPTLSIGAYLYLKNNLAKCHRDPTWNDGALGFFEEHRPKTPNKNNKNNKMSSDMGSVPDLVMHKIAEYLSFG